jgi:hypothetical protein
VVDQALVDSIPVLAALPPPARAALADAFDEVTVPGGERVVSEGDFAYKLFVILEGTAQVEQDRTHASRGRPQSREQDAD